LEESPPPDVAGTGGKFTLEPSGGSGAGSVAPSGGPGAGGVAASGGSGAGGVVPSGGSSGGRTQQPCTHELTVGSTPVIAPAAGEQSQAQRVVSADFNGDGILDLGVMGKMPGAVWARAFLGRGDGTFVPSSEYATIHTQNDSGFMAAGDFTGDGQQDLALLLASPFGSKWTQVFAGRGDGNFDAGAQQCSAGSLVFSLLAGDVNGDGALDLLTTDFSSDQVVVWYGELGASFSGPATFGVGDGPWNAALADFDGDGRADLATTNAYGNSVSVLFARASAYVRSDFDVTVEPLGLAAGDLNGDGAPDLVAGSFHTLSVLLNQRDGTFSRDDYSVASDNLDVIAFGDLDEDGAVDIVAGTAQVLFGRGGGTFGPAETLAHPPGQVQGMALGDFNRDGHLDVADAMSSAGVGILLGDGRGRFRFDAFTESYDAGQDPAALVAADFNRDGHPDLVVADRSSSSLSFLAGDGTGMLTDTASIPTNGPVTFLAASDFDRDGMLDLAVSAGGSSMFGVLLGKGDGTFASPLPGTVAGLVGGLTPLDVNADGNPDLAFTSFMPGGVILALGTGTGEFVAGPFIMLEEQAEALGAADVNGDGATDLVVGLASGTLDVLLADGGGGLLAADRVKLDGGTYTVALGDLNDDGIADLIAGDISSCHVFLGRGDGHFGSPSAIPFDQPVHHITLVDMDGDGLVDVVGSWQYGIEIAYNRGGATFRSRASAYAVSAAGIGPAVADFNGDGTPDVATGGESQHSVSVLLNVCEPRD
jgi:hypothetical protein